MNTLGYFVEQYIMLSGALFTLGCIGFLVRRNVLVQLMSIELMLNAVNLMLVAFNRQHAGRPERAGVRLLHHRGGRGRSRCRPGDRTGFLPAEVQRPKRRSGPASSLNL